MTKKRILILSLSWLANDPRVLVQYDALQNDYEIETAALGALKPNLPHTDLNLYHPSGWRKILLYVLLTVRQFGWAEKMEFACNKKALPINKVFDLIICNDLSSMPLATAISKGQVPIWLDLHEFSPREFDNHARWKFFYQPYKHWQAKKYLPQASVRTTVCQALATEYTIVYGTPIEQLIFNLPAYEPALQPTPVTQTIKLVHHGVATPHRRLEHMISLVRELGPSFSLDFYLVAKGAVSQAYEQQLKELAHDLPIRFNKAVGTKEIATTLNQYDMGVFILEPVNFNYLNALPNKFFEFIQARLAIAITPNPEMKTIVEQYDLGVVATDYGKSSLAARIKALSSEDLNRYKQNTNRIALPFSAVDSIKKIRAIVKNSI